MFAFRFRRSFVLLPPRTLRRPYTHRKFLLSMCRCLCYTLQFSCGFLYYNYRKLHCLQVCLPQGKPVRCMFPTHRKNYRFVCRPFRMIVLLLPRILRRLCKRSRRLTSMYNRLYCSLQFSCGFLYYSYRRPHCLRVCLPQGNPARCMFPMRRKKYRFVCRPFRMIVLLLPRIPLGSRKNSMCLLPNCPYYCYRLLFLFWYRNCRRLHLPRVCLPQGKSAPCMYPMSRKCRRRM